MQLPLVTRLAKAINKARPDDVNKYTDKLRGTALRLCINENTLDDILKKAGVQGVKNQSILQSIYHPDPKVPLHKTAGINIFEPFLHGINDRPQAENKLSTAKEGAWLMWYNDAKRQHVISLKVSENKIVHNNFNMHLLTNRQPPLTLGQFLGALAKDQGVEVNINTGVRATLEDKPLSNEIFEGQPFFHKKNDETPEEKLKNTPEGTWFATYSSDEKCYGFYIQDKQSPTPTFVRIQDLSQYSTLNEIFEAIETIEVSDGELLKLGTGLSEEEYEQIKRDKELNERFNHLKESTHSYQNEQQIPRENVHSNFPDVICHARTAIRIMAGEKEKPIHANIVSLKENSFICSQYPHAQAHGLFWRAVVKNTDLIFDLTSEKDVQKRNFTHYYPKPNEEITVKINVGTPYKPIYEDIKIKWTGDETLSNIPNEKEEPITEITSNIYEITDVKTGKTKTVRRYNYTCWPDYGVISTESLKKTVSLLNKHKEESSKSSSSPPLLHCSAGVGRTGTICTATAIINGISKKEVTEENYLEFIDDRILEGRSDRGPLFVQTVEQYKLLVDLAEEELGLRKRRTPKAEE